MTDKTTENDLTLTQTQQQSATVNICFLYNDAYNEIATNSQTD